MSFRFLAAVVAVVVPMCASAAPNVLTHQGRLTDILGVPVDAPTELDIFLYRADSGGSALWTDEFTLTPEAGFYSVTLGQDVANPIADSVFDGSIYLSVSIDNGAESSRQLLASVPFAARAGVADSLSAAGLAQVLAASSTCSGQLVNGVCLIDVGPATGFIAGAQYCAALGADMCTDSQNTLIRNDLGSSLGAVWSSSFADNDGNSWNVSNGGTGDNHSATTSYGVTCCSNATPSRVTDVSVGGVRLVSESTVAVNWASATTSCGLKQSDICSTGQSYVLRANGRLTSGANWTSDHADNDGGQASIGNGGTSDNTSPSQSYRYACCATDQPMDLSCPSPATDVGGVCMTSINNVGGNFATAASSCASEGSSLCSMSQTGVLRAAGVVTHSGSWTESYSDNDSNNASVAIGNVGDNHNNSSIYGWACCY
jgi:hypothetical protein